MRIPLGDGASLLVEGPPVAVSDGPVQAGRAADAIRSIPGTLEAALGPVRQATQTVLHQLREAGPDEIEVEFGINLAAQAGAVIAKSEANVHLRVKVSWKHSETVASP